MILSNVEVICFDYYGTLVDIGQPFEKIKQWFSKFLKIEDSEIPVDYFFMTFSKQRAKLLTNKTFLNGYQILEGSYTNTCKRYGLTPYLEEYKNLIEYLFTTPKVYDDVKETINILKQNYKIALITNADNDIIKTSIENQELSFDFIVTSEDAKCNKPSYGIFKYAINIIGIQSSKLLMVGDSLTEDIIPAEEIGLDVIWLNRNKNISNYKINEIISLKELLK